jgi:DNA-binding IclR family transcriptional regulator
LDHLPVKLREALLHALRSERPPHSLPELAAAVGRDRRTLSRLWREAAHPDTCLRLEDIPDWLLLLQALARRRAGTKWAAVAASLGVHEATLRRQASRLTGTGLPRLAEMDRSAAIRRFASLLRDAMERRPE